MHAKHLKHKLREQLISNTIFSQSFASETTSYAVRNKVSLLPTILQAIKFKRTEINSTLSVK